MLRAVLFSVVVTASASVLAEVLTLEGTIKSVDAATRSITITRKTPKGEKVLELEVAKNAGDLSALKAGEKVGFSYDPELELVTKIANAATTDAVEALQGIWIATAVDRHGTMMTKQELKEQARRIIIEGNVFRQEETRDGKVSFLEGTFTVDPSSRAFDFQGKGPKGHPLKLIGLYEVSGDSLRICFRADINGKAERPDEFRAGPEGPNWTLSYTCRRIVLDE